MALNEKQDSIEPFIPDSVSSHDMAFSNFSQVIFLSANQHLIYFNKSSNYNLKNLKYFSVAYNQKNFIIQVTLYE